MKAEEIREMSDADIRTRIGEMEEERFRLKFRSATETLEDPLRLRTIRRDIARLKTILRERELATSAESTTTGQSGTRPRRVQARDRSVDHAIPRLTIVLRIAGKRPARVVPRCTKRPFGVSEPEFSGDRIPGRPVRHLEANHHLDLLPRHEIAELHVKLVIAVHGHLTIPVEGLGRRTLGKPDT